MMPSRQPNGFAKMQKTTTSTLNELQLVEIVPAVICPRLFPITSVRTMVRSWLSSCSSIRQQTERLKRIHCGT